MKAYKFLRDGAIAPLTGFRWEEGVWVEAERAAPCDEGVHACRIRDLPYWLRAELWEIELDGQIVEAEHKVVASRGRLVGRVDAWDARSFAAFARACAARTQALAASEPSSAKLRQIAADTRLVLSRGQLPLVPYFASVAAEEGGGERARLAEREQQAAWLEEHVLHGRPGPLRRLLRL